MIEFRPVEDREDSEYNEGWRFALVCAGATVLLGIQLCLLGIIWGLFR